MRFHNNQITLEVTNSNLLIYNVRPFADTRPVRNLPPAFIGVGTITPIFSLCSEMLVQVATLFFVPVDVLIDGFMRGHRLVIRFFKISMNLFRRPILQQSLVNLLFNGAVNNVISTTVSFLFTIVLIGVVCAISVGEQRLSSLDSVQGCMLTLMSYIRFGNPLGIHYFFSLLIFALATMKSLFVLQNLKFEEER